MSKINDPKDLESSIPFEFDITSISTPMLNLAHHLEIQCSQDNGQLRRNSSVNERHLLNLLSNCYKLSSSDEQHLRYRRSNNTDGIINFKKSSPYNAEKITNYYLLPIISMMEENGFLKNDKGFFDHDICRGKISRMRPTERLEKAFDIFKIMPEHIIYSKNVEIIILKDEEKRGIDYIDTDDIRIMRKELSEYNNLASSTNIEINGKKQNNIITRRIFNNSSLNEGGRIYGGKWQSIKSPLRRNIKINDNPIIELDFQCLHPRLLYNLKKINPTNNLYELDNYERDVIKLAFVRLINCESLEKARSSILRRLRKKDDHKSMKKRDAEELIRSMVQKHSLISECFFKGQGTKLQYLDSCVAMDIINEFTNSGQVVLSVHDSFICEFQNEDKLRQSMLDCYKKRFGFEPIIVKK